MADWRQIQARIRKAKNASDPLPKLTELYQRTRDAMVAWELGAIQEKAEMKEQAAHWYTIAAQRFRRADWKKKAEEALTRLGVELPMAAAESEPGERAVALHPDEQKSYDASEDSHSDEKIESAVRQPESHENSETTLPLALGEIPEETQPGSATHSSSTATARSSVNAGANAGGIAADAEKKKRRRGRRGGRGRRRKGANGAPGLPTQAYAESAESQGAARPPAQSRAPSMLPAEGADSLYEPRRGAAPHTPTHTPLHAPSRGGATSNASSASRAASPSHVASSQASSESATARRFMPPEADLAETTNRVEVDRTESAANVEPRPAQLPSERAAHGRAGNPALASRMAQLESMLRRLLGSPLHRLDEADEAPAGPGVFLLSDADQITTYYVEACQTLRIGLGNLARGGGRAQKGRPGAGGGRGYSDSGLKAKLAEYLGINEAKVSQYLKDHCVVRWVQLDEDAPHLAHFSVAVLRTPLNIE